MEGREQIDKWRDLFFQILAVGREHLPLKLEFHLQEGKNWLYVRCREESIVSLKKEDEEELWKDAYDTLRHWLVRW